MDWVPLTDNDDDDKGELKKDLLSFFHNLGRSVFQRPSKKASLKVINGGSRPWLSIQDLPSAQKG